MKAKLLHLFSVATFLFAVFAGCSGDESMEQARSEEFLMPLKVGNSWTYRFFEVDPTTGDTTFSAQGALRIVGTTMEEGSLYYATPDAEVLQNRSDGLFLADYDPDTGEFSDDIFFKFPAQNGEIYTYNTLETGEQIRIKVTNQTITVPAGTFDSYGYQFIDLPFQSVFYFSPGVGLIRIQKFDHKGNNSLLLSFNLVE